MINKRKRGALMLPLRQHHAEDIATRAAKAISVGLETVWFEELEIPASAKRRAADFRSRGRCIRRRRRLSRR